MRIFWRGMVGFTFKQLSIQVRQIGIAIDIWIEDW